MAPARAFLSTGVPSGATRPSQCITQEIPRRIHVPVVELATGASPLLNGKRQLLRDSSAGRASLAAGKPAIRQHDFRTVQRRLVQQLAPELMEADVDNRSSESLVRHHAFDVQVLDPDHAGSLHQTAGGLVQPVPPKVGDASVQSGQFPSVLTPIAASFYLPAVLAGQPPPTAASCLASLRAF